MGSIKNMWLAPADYIRKHFFGVDPRLEAMVAGL